MLSENEYDAVIVGGRVAGSSLALLLGLRGYRVLLIDRDEFPSDTLSTHIMGPYATPLLQRLGVLEDVLATGLRRIVRTRTCFADCVFEGPVGPLGTFALTPRRDRFDAILVEHAVRRGNVEFHDRTRAERLIEEGGRVVGVAIRTAREGLRDVRARVVVGADGKNSQVAAWVSAPTYEAVPGMRPGYYGYFHGVTPLLEPTVELFFQDDQIGFIFPMEPGVDCLAIEAQPKDFDEFRQAPEAVLVERFAQFHGMAARLKHATLEGKARGARSVENYFRKPYGPGWVLTGDAAYCKDPSTGFGMGDALTQALMLDEPLSAALNGADWDSTLAAYQEKRDQTMQPFYQMTLGFTRASETPPESLAWMRAVLSAPPFIRMLAAEFPTALAAPGVIPPPTLEGLAGIVRRLTASPADAEGVR
jgi:flavin-dependent dehydrogenase